MGMSGLKISNTVGIFGSATSSSNCCSYPLLLEFSVSLQEMGACLLQKTALNEDEDSGMLNLNFLSMPLITVGV